MIYTVTFNPTIDHTVYLPHIQPGRVNRAERDTLRPGGKGVNVSIMLTRLGAENRALGFAAGFTGAEFCRMLQAEGCDEDFIRLPNGRTRINLVLETGEETEINCPGPSIPKAELGELMAKLDALAQGDVLVLAGSVPPSLPSDIYEHIMQTVSPKGVLCTVDATGDLLRRVLPLRPFLVKPNILELGNLYGVTLATAEEAKPYAQRMQAEGARNVLVSMDANGAFLLDEAGGFTTAPAPKGTVQSAVGSGDSMVAGFLAGWQATGSHQSAFALGLAAGSASAFDEWLAPRADVLRLLAEVFPAGGQK